MVVCLSSKLAEVLLPDIAVVVVVENIWSPLL